MADYSTLYIGDKEILSWIWDIPSSGDPLLNFIFIPEDKKIEKVENDADELYHCTYKTIVHEVKKRFDRLHFSINEIDQVISEITGIPLEKIEIATLDYDSFYDKYAPPLGEDNEEIISRWEKLGEDKYDIDKKMEKAELGLYPGIRYIRTILDCSRDDEAVYLDMDSILEYEDSPDKFSEINIISDDFDTLTKLERKYLETAKVHFTTCDFDLVYIELIIAIETAIKQYLRYKYQLLSRTDNKSLNLESMVKDLSLIDLIKFGIVFLGERELDDSLIQSIKKTYDKRNNIIHNQAKRFIRIEVIEAIETTEKVINIIGELN